MTGRQLPRSVALWLGLGLYGLLAGCGGKTNDGPARFQVSGEVTYDGQPVPKGDIFFEPDGSKGNSGPQSRATIQDGQFETEPGKGMIGGPHKVRITGTDGKPANVEGEELPGGLPLFPPYETQIDFPQEDTEQSFNVPKAGT